MKCRIGPSKLECVLIVLIAGTLGGLLLSAIERMRAAEALSRCKNNLKQLALGCQNYNDANNGHLPPLTDQGAAAPTGHGLASLFVTLMPYMEGGIVSFQPNRTPPREYYAPSSVKFTYQDMTGEKITEAGGFANRRWAVFVDPADPTANRIIDVPMTLPDGAAGYYASGSYAANGLVFGGNDATLPKSFSDGIANTILLAEKPQVCRSAGGETIYNIWGLGFFNPNMPAFATLTPTDPPGLQSTGQIAPALPLPTSFRPGIMPVQIGTESAPREPSPAARSFQVGLNSRSPCDPRIPGSPHPGGMLAGMADGSVKLLARSMSDWSFWALCTPDGNESPYSDWPE